MKLMIVEDEARLRQSLAGGIPWEEHGIELVALAANGAEALQLFDRKKPDILLLDVQMPEMDGLTLVRKLRERDACVKAIILSGHDNFAYAQQAVEAGVSQYLLKPAGDREILEAVVLAADQLRQELSRRYDAELLRQKWQDHLPQLRSGFVERLLRGSVPTGEAERMAADYGLAPQAGARFAVAVVDAEPLDDTADSRHRTAGGEPLEEPDRSRDPSPGRLAGTPEPAQAIELARARFSVYLLAQSLLPEDACWLCMAGQDPLAIVFVLPPGADDRQGLVGPQALLDKLLGRARDGFQLQCSAGISGSAGTLGELGRLYDEACRALRDRLVYGPGIVIPYREEPHREPAGTVLPAVGEGGEKALEIALELGDAEAADLAFEQLWNEGLAGAGTADEIHEGVLHLSSLLVRFVQKQGLAVKEVMEGGYPFFLNTTQLLTKEKIRAWLQGCVLEIAAYQARRRKSSRHHFVQTLLDIARDEIDQEVTLHTAADRLYVNSSYLSRLFKQEMGQTFSAYVLEMKMEKAKAALSEGAKVYDAARMVGYRDVSYFTKVFRKYWGVTPGGLKQ